MAAYYNGPIPTDVIQLWNWTTRTWQKILYELKKLWGAMYSYFVVTVSHELWKLTHKASLLFVEGWSAAFGPPPGWIAELPSFSLREIMDGKNYRDEEWNSFTNAVLKFGTIFPDCYKHRTFLDDSIPLIKSYLEKIRFDSSWFETLDSISTARSYLESGWAQFPNDPVLAATDYLIGWKDDSLSRVYEIIDTSSIEDINRTGQFYGRYILLLMITSQFLTFFRSQYITYVQPYLISMEEEYPAGKAVHNRGEIDSKLAPIRLATALAVNRFK